VLTFLADENYNNQIVRALVRRHPELDLVRVQDVGLTSADDPTVLAWAAEQGRLVLTHDVQTMIDFAYERVRDGEGMPGLVVVRRYLSHKAVIEDILILAFCSHVGEWENQVIHLPL
jgi:predicted nuclease of predicted toxin-antitoxin system